MQYAKEIKKVTILLTTYSDLFSRFISFIGGGYSHVSIAIDENEEIFYSFNKKGFCIEKPRKYRPKTRRDKSICIHMQVPEETYRKIEEEITGFVENKSKYKYSRIGVVLCLLHIPHKFKNRYFCSQFIAEILIQAKAIETKKNESLYLPVQLMEQICQCFPNMEQEFNVLERQ